MFYNVPDAESWKGRYGRLVGETGLSHLEEADRADLDWRSRQRSHGTMEIRGQRSSHRCSTASICANSLRSPSSS